MHEEKEEKDRRGSAWGYRASSCCYEQSGAGNNWAAGYASTRMAESVIDMVRAQAEESDKGLDTIMTLQSSAGGTGAGLGARATKTLRDEFGGRRRVPCQHGECSSYPIQFGRSQCATSEHCAHSVSPRGGICSLRHGGSLKTTILVKLLHQA